MLFASKSPFAWEEEKEFQRLKALGLHADTKTGEIQSENTSIERVTV